MIVSCHKQ